jgi:hypothetical protein
MGEEAPIRRGMKNSKTPRMRSAFPTITRRF